MNPMKHTYAIVLAGALTAAVPAHAQDKQTQQAVPRSAPANRGVERSSAPERTIQRSAPPARTEGGSTTRATSGSSAAAADDDQGRPRTAHSGGGSVRSGTARSGGSTARAVPRSQPSDGSREAPGSGTVVASPRSRDGRQSYGVATARRYPPHYGHGGGYYPWSDPWWWNSYPYSFGFFLWDPFWYGASYPVYGGYYGGGYYGGGGYDDPGYGYGSSGYGLYGSLKLKVKPRDAEVYADGLFVGHVDDFDGLFQKLNLESGPHRIEIRAPRYETLSIDVRIEFDETVTYRGELQRVQ
jgi:hypothetical protein